MKNMKNLITVQKLKLNRPNLYRLSILVAAVAFAKATTTEDDYYVLNQFKGEVDVAKEIQAKAGKDSDCAGIPLNFIQFTYESLELQLKNATLAGSAQDQLNTRRLMVYSSTQSLAKMNTDFIDSTDEDESSEDLVGSDEHRSAKGKYSKRAAAENKKEINYYYVKRGDMSVKQQKFKGQYAGSGMPDNISADDFKKVLDYYETNEGSDLKGYVAAVGIGQDSTEGFDQLLMRDEAEKLADDLATKVSGNNSIKANDEKLAVYNAYLALRKQYAANPKLCGSDLLYANFKLFDTDATKDKEDEEIKGTPAAAVQARAATDFLSSPGEIKSPSDFTAKMKKRFVRELTHCPGLGNAVLGLADTQAQKKSFKERYAADKNAPLFVNGEGDAAAQPACMKEIAEKLKIDL